MAWIFNATVPKLKVLEPMSIKGTRVDVAVNLEMFASIFSSQFSSLKKKLEMRK